VDEGGRTIAPASDRLGGLKKMEQWRKSVLSGRSAGRNQIIKKSFGGALNLFLME
jgi:hypothetical protein